MNYRLTRLAIDDIDTLLYQIAEYSGWKLSMKTEETLFAAFHTIGTIPGIGHLRRDLLPREIYFYFTKPYLILYRRDTPHPVIGAVIHGARDIASLLAERTF